MLKWSDLDSIAIFNMRRKARPSALVRHRQSSLVQIVQHQPVINWPPLLNKARSILSEELKLPDSTARLITLSAVEAAQACGAAIRRRGLDISEYRTRQTLRTRFDRLCKCAMRAPAPLRRKLNERVISFELQGWVDTEVIERIFDEVATVFMEYKHNISKTALAVMVYQQPDDERLYNILKNDFSSLSGPDRLKCERILKSSATKKGAKLTAAQVFGALAEALGNKEKPIPTSQIHRILVDYVEVVARTWKATGLKPSVARHDADPSYKSRFHRFCDLVVAAVIEPWTHRHDVGLANLLQKKRANYLSFPAKYRAVSSPALDRTDVEWLISEDHIRKALKLIQKTPSDTP